MFKKLRSIIGYIFGVLGFLFAISTWEPEVRILAIEQSDTPLGYVGLKTNDISVKLLVKGIDNVWYIDRKAISLKNIGTEPLLGSDIRSPIHVKLEKGVTLLDPSVSFSTNPDEQEYRCYIRDNKLYFEFDIIDPNQGFECRFYLAFTTGNSILPSESTLRIVGRIHGWRIEKAPNKRPMIYFLVDFIVYSIIGAFLTLGLLFAFTKAPFGKRFDKLTTIAASHDKRMGKINKKYSLLNSKMRRRVFLNQFVSFVLIVLPIILAFYFATQGIDFSWNLAKQFGIAIDSVPLFPRTY